MSEAHKFIEIFAIMADDIAFDLSYVMPFSKKGIFVRFTCMFVHCKTI